MDEFFEVVASTGDALRKILSQKTEISEVELNRKLHLSYFDGYFAEKGAQTIVVEHNYIDHDYMEDHAEYYVRCFKEYHRKCTRLHFFDIDFSADDFRILLSGEENPLSVDNLQKGYLGFVVVKPLPKTIIGRTCLATYPHNNCRYFPVVRSYTANLFGISLKVEYSLAFQEQDAVVAACATSALWTVFQGTGMLFQHAIPSPSVITKAATVHITDSDRTRAFPSAGLDVIEMARAIKHVGLEPNAIKVSNTYILKGTAYAYLRMGIPMILGFPLIDVSVTPNSSMGKHAVALTGYSLPTNDPLPFGPRNFRLKANRINKFYAHDDQVGPFARMEFDGKHNIDVKDEDGSIVTIPSLSTSWPGKNALSAGRAVPEVLVIPLYHKIRIPFGLVNDHIMEIDVLFEYILRNEPTKSYDINKYEWDIYLTTVNQIKTESFRDVTRNPTDRVEMLLSRMPKYIWRATLEYQGKKLVDIFLDATDLEQGSCVNSVVCYDLALTTFIKQKVQDPVVVNTFKEKKIWPIVEWIQRNRI